MTEAREREIERFRGLIEDGILRIGMTRPEVKEAPGEPDDGGGTSRRYRTPSIFLYGQIEVYFGPRASHGLTMVFSEDVDGGEAVTLLSADLAADRT